MTSKKCADRCSYCTKNVVRSFSVTCADCDKCVLCSDCFAAGVEIASHKNNHKYKVADCLEYPLFVKDWNVGEELALLEGIERFGMGNWKVIADHINTNKSTKQVEEHYWELFMGVHGYCLPSQFMWKDQLQSTADFCPEIKEEEQQAQAQGQDMDLFRVPPTEGYARGEQVRRDEGFSGLGGHSTKSANKDKQDLRDKLAMLPGSDLPGFLPLRGDFDNEYENDADKMLADMEFSLDEHPSERELKLQVIRIYNHKLQERNRRKDFVIERGLIDFKQQQQQDKRRTKEERELVGKLRVFARFQTKEEHDALVEGMLRAGRLRQQIELYRTYRQMGVRTLEQARQYEASKRIRERDMKARKHRDSAPHLFQSQQSAFSQPSQLDLQDGAADSGKLTGRRRGRDSSSNLQAEEAAAASANPSGRKSVRGGTSSTALSATAHAGAGMDEDCGAGESAYLSYKGPFYNSPAGGKCRGTGEAASAGACQEDPALLAKAPGGDLLSELELEFCSQVPMMPLHYLAAKDAIVREAYRNGQLTQEGVKRLFKLDANGSEKIYDFFVKEMLINESPRNTGARC